MSTEKFPIVTMYMAQIPYGDPIPEPNWIPVAPAVPTIKPGKITISVTPHPDTADLLELLAAIDDYVRGKAITEEIMSLRAKAVVIRDRMQRRQAP